MNKTITYSSFSGTLTPPCSKSYAQRALAAALLCEGQSTLRNLAMCDDTKHALRIIEALGAKVAPFKVEDLGFKSANCYTIDGGLNPRTNAINVGESGLAARLFTPIAAMSGQHISVVGEGSMLKRPIGMMIKPLEELGAQVKCDGYLPIEVEGRLTGGNVEVEGWVSSQFVTGLMMALPLAEQDSIINVKDARSVPYLAMTIDLAKQFGVEIEHNDFEEFYIKGNQKYTPQDTTIEGDWSSAAFWLVAGAIAGEITLENMNPTSLQADAVIVELLSMVGAQVITTLNSVSVAKRELTAFDFDATDCPDLFPVLVVLASQCEGESHIKGAERLIHKESNRAVAIMEQLGGLGVDIDIDCDLMTIKGGSEIAGECDSVGDHRIAMAAAIAGLVSHKGVTIHRAEAVSKSYPNFWEELELIQNE